MKELIKSGVLIRPARGMLAHIFGPRLKYEGSVVSVSVVQLPSLKMFEGANVFPSPGEK